MTNLHSSELMTNWIGTPSGNSILGRRRHENSDEVTISKACLATNLPRFYRLVSSVLILLSLLVSRAVYADESRLEILAESYLIENLQQEGHWEVDVGEERINYKCLICNGELVARLEIISPYHSDPFTSRSERYLSERRRRCVDLVVNDLGRCIGTQDISFRGGALRGFQSETHFLSNREVEVVFFYHDPRWPGPEMIKTTIYMARGFSLPNGSVEMFMWHMARLTLYW